MGSSRELKDFVASFQAGYSAMENSEYKKALADYYRRKGTTGGGKSLFGYTPEGNDKPKTSFFGRLFGEDKPAEPALSDVDQGIKNLQSVRQQALRAGDLGTVAKIDKSIADNKGILGAPSGTATPKAAPKPSTPAIPAAPANPSEGKFTPSGKPALTPDRINYEQKEEEPQIENATLDQEQDDAPKIENANFDMSPVLEETMEASHGGMVRAQYAEPGGAIGEMDDEDGEDEGDETRYDETAGSDEHEEDASHGISVQMARAAEPAIAAGLKHLASTAQQDGAIPDGSPNRLVHKIAHNEDAASHDEIAAIDKVVDPENKLPPSAKAAARIAAVYDFYDKRGESDKGAELVTRLMLHDKQNAQTRGVLAQDAANRGDFKAATKLIEDAHNNDLPTGDIMKANLTDDGSGDVKIIRANGSEEDMKVTPQLVAQAAKGAANGSEYMNWAMSIAAGHEQRKSDKAKPSAIDNELFDNLRRTKRAFARALNTDDGSDESKANIQKYADQLDTLEDKVQDWAKKQKSPANVLKYYGVSEVPSSTLNPYSKKGQLGAKTEPKLSAKEREQKAADDEINGIRKRLETADMLEQSGVEVDENGKALTRREVGYKATDEEKTKAAKSIAPIRQRLEAQLADTAYEQAEGRDEFRKGTDFKTRIGDYKEGLDSYLTSINPDDNKKPVDMDDKTKKEYYNVMDEIARKADTNPERIARFVHNAVTSKQPPSIERSTGRMISGGEKFYVSRDVMERIGRLRGENMVRERDTANKKAESDADWNSVKDTVGALTGLGKPIVVPIAPPPEPNSPLGKTLPPKSAIQNDPRDRFAVFGSRRLPVD
jgi:hypothetical protein